MSGTDRMAREHAAAIEKTPWAPTDDILRMSAAGAKRLRGELELLYARAFPKISPSDQAIFVGDFFTPPGPGCRRTAGLFRDAGGALFGAVVFAHGPVAYGGHSHSAIYLLSRAVAPRCQGMGAGKAIALKVMADFAPDLLITTSGQSPALHSWIRLSQGGELKGYDAYPRLAGGGAGGHGPLARSSGQGALARSGGQELLTMPDEKMGLTLAAFRTLYAAILGGDAAALRRVLSTINLLMVRRGMFRQRYDFDPWRPGGRPDPLAEALELADGDGVLVTLIKR